MSGDQPLIPPLGKSFKIKDYDPAETNGLKREAGEAELEKLRVRLNELQDMMYADERYALLVVLQGIDASGKDGVSKSVFREVSPLGCSVVGFGAPSDEEKHHDYLWRIHTACPEKGKIVIFNRSHYESVLVERVRGFAPEERWKGRYDEINRFEELLTHESTVVMKFFLHISEDEQRERLQARVNDPTKRWKFRMGDLEDRKLWADYQSAFQDMIDECNTKHAPWHVVPADKKWYRDVVIARAIIERLEQLDLRYPEPEKGVVGLTVV
ncbi:MAG: PPK2 family polyphosphate kinase [Tepidisphaeraceae bacterium]